ncbi:Uncharacterized protein TCM_033225 [Theobroma cacao]|uniref:Uncharacterized protein n=1 Tax=Theobroma cacao TaxID=3641 RepID=A0A061FAK0_THECC|nr:Uncharacterized protein TCM_033225 [Theobroma cacao]
MCTPNMHKVISSCALPTCRFQYHRVHSLFAQAILSSTLPHPIMTGMCIPHIAHTDDYIYYTILTINTQHIYINII